MDPTPNDLLTYAWTELARAVPDTKHGFHWPVASTVDADGAPSARVVVLRSAEQVPAAFTFHTDRRAPKVDQIERAPTVALTFHDGRLKLQLRALCAADVHRDGELADAGWSRIGSDSRRCYLAPHAPSTAAEALSHNLPPHVLRRALTDEDVAPGRRQFAVVRCVVRSIDMLVVAPEGHRRARFDFEGGELRAATWLHP